MKLIDYKFFQNHGDDHYISIMRTKKWSLFELNLSWSEYSTLFYFSMTTGRTRLLQFNFEIYKLGIGFKILGHNWFRNE